MKVNAEKYSWFVTFSVKKIGCDRQRYAVYCKDEDTARDIALDINSFDGIDYLRISRYPHINKDIIMYDGERYYEKGYFSF